jgi:hypothetical protein
MSISFKHAFTNPKSDGGDATIVRPSNWNAEHTVLMDSGFFAGRVAAGNGVMEELTPAQARTLADVDQAGVVGTVNTQAGLAYTLVLADKGKVVEMSNASPNTLTIPANASVAFPLRTLITVIQYGAGQTTIAASGGVVLRSLGSALKTSGQYAAVSLYKRGTDEWVVFGSTTT